MNTLEHKIPKEVYKWLLEYAIITEIRESVTYSFMPYYFKMIDEELSLVKTYSLENLPDELRDAISNERKEVKNERDQLLEDTNVLLNNLSTKQIKSTSELLKAIL